jgi:proteasome assembly chaperone 3
MNQKIMPIQTPSADMQSMSLENGGIEPALFPAATKQAAGLVNGVQTDVSSVNFADKILITISQGGRLSQWVRLIILF